MDPSQQVRLAALNAQIAALPPDVRAAIIADGLDESRTVLSTPIYSSIRFQCDSFEDPPGTLFYTISPEPRRAFQYGIGSLMTVAGFPAASTCATPNRGNIATESHTNLLRAGETNSNADVWFWGLSCELWQQSEPSLAAMLWDLVHLDLTLNGTDKVMLGTLGMYPGSGGLFGAGLSQIIEPALNIPGGSAGEQGAVYPFMSNGNPLAGSYRRFPQPFKWAALGGGAAKDSNMAISATVPGGGILQGGTVRPPAPPEVAGFGAAPSAGVTIRMQLQSVSIGRRSVNV